MATRLFERDPRSQADDPLTGYRRLAGAVIIQGMREAARGSIEALDFLEDRQAAGDYFDLAGVDRLSVFQWIVAGCKRIPGQHYGEHTPTRKARSTPTQDFDTYDNPEVETRRLANNG